MRRRTRIPEIFLLLLVGTVIFLIPRLLNRNATSHPLAFRSSFVDQFPVAVTDNLGRSVSVSQRPLRLVSLAPSITEILFAIHAGDRLVADTNYCHYPPEAVQKPKVGDYLSPNVEKVAAEKPDLVFCDDLNGKEMVDHLAALKITAIVIAPKSLSEVEQAISLIGRAVGETKNADDLVHRMEGRREAVLAKTTSLPDAQRPRALFLFSMDQGLYSAGPGSYIDDFIRTAGGRNIAATANSPWPVLSLETAVEADPEVILILKGHGKKSEITDQSALALFRAKPHWQTVTAVKQARIVTLDDDPATLPGPRMVDGLEAIAAALHPELFGKK